MMPLAWLLQSLLLFHCCSSSGSAVRASRYAHYTPPQPLVLQAHSLQRCGLQDYLASSSITYLLMHCLGLKPTMYTEIMLIFGTRLEAIKIRTELQVFGVGTDIRGFVSTTAASPKQCCIGGSLQAQPVQTS